MYISIQSTFFLEKCKKQRDIYVRNKNRELPDQFNRNLHEMLGLRL